MVIDDHVQLHYFIHLLLLQLLLLLLLLFFLLTFIYLLSDSSSLSLLTLLRTFCILILIRLLLLIEEFHTFLRNSINRIISLLSLNVQKATYLTSPPIPKSFRLSLSFNYYILFPSSSYPSPSIFSPSQLSNHLTTHTSRTIESEYEIVKEIEILILKAIDDINLTHRGHSISLPSLMQIPAVRLISQ